jgi:hypothetical protein
MAQEDECTVCCENITNDFCPLQCGHVFHKKCLHEWQKKENTCPLCREEIKEKEPLLIYDEQNDKLEEEKEDLVLDYVLVDKNEEFNKNLYWGSNIGHMLVDNVSFQIGGAPIDTHHQSWLDIWDELTHHNK